MSIGKNLDAPKPKNRRLAQFRRWHTWGGLFAGLTREIMTIQAEGDYAKSQALGQRLGVIRPPVQKALDKLSAVPVDIEPLFTTADQLLSEKDKQ